MSSTTSHHHQHAHAPPAVQTHAQQALQRYPHLLVPGLENASQVFALVAESLGQKPSPSNHGSKNTRTDRDAGKAVVESAVGATYQPQGIPHGEKVAQNAVQQGVRGKVDGKEAEKRRKEWVRRLGVVFDFEVTPTSSTSGLKTGTTKTPPTTHFYIDLFSTGTITLPAPAVLQKHSADPSSPTTWSRRHVITIKITDRDLLAVSIGERVPVKLFSEGRLRVKGDIHKALLLGKLLSITRFQIYADADAESPTHDLYSVHPKHSQPAEKAVSGGNRGGAVRGDLEGAGMQGQGAPAGGAEWGVGALREGVVARAKL